MAEFNAYAEETFVLLVIFQNFGFIPWCMDAENESGGLRHFKIGVRQVLQCCATNVALCALIIYASYSQYNLSQVNLTLVLCCGVQ
jgi:hypothetical protein